MAPRLSICVTTYNRAAILDDCLERLGVLADHAPQIELVVSDNGSTDDTPAVIAAHAARNPAIAAHRLPENRGMWANRLNALFQARGDLVVFLADDDSLMLEPLLEHVERMERQPDLAATYVDWISWDDQEGAEMHRYFNLDAPAEFGPEDPIGLVNFVLHWNIPPEVAVYRREALIRSQPGFSHTLPFHAWMYAVSRLGRVRFDLGAFYKEHRILKAKFARTHWANMQLQLQYIGDEMRLTLEQLLLLALQDAGMPQVPQDQAARARASIDRILDARIDLEINRARVRGDFILAVELRRRQVLWNGPGSRDDVHRDLMQLVVPAALQSVHDTARSLSDVDGLCLRGFVSDMVRSAFAARYPDMPLVEDASEGRALVLYRDEAALSSDPAASAARHRLSLDQVIAQFRLAPDRIEVGTL